MDGFYSFLRSLGPGRLIAMASVAAALIGFFAFLTVRITTPPMAPLFTGLDMEDSSRILQRLESTSVPFRLTGDGSTILVPETQVLRLRMSLAEEGLPSGGSVGYEIFDQTSTLGTSGFVQNINYLRALEGELSRTIRALDRVDAVRVHLVMPERELFSREQPKASAAVVLRTRGARITQPQIQAIRNLVAAAVPNLQVNQISIIDQRGVLLARGGDTDEGILFASNLEERKLSYETRLKKQLESLLEEIVGEGKVRAEVAAEIDFDRVTTNAEIYDPDSQVVRSTQTIEETAASRDRSSLGGNEITVANNLPDANQGQSGTGANTSNNSRLEETVNYEISKTIRTEIHEAGTIKRLSVAVLVDGTYIEADDATLTYQQRSAQELESLSALVRSAIGFDSERGDIVEVINLQFSRIEVPDLPEIEASFLNLTTADYFRIGEMLALTLIALLIIFFVIRPMMLRLLGSDGMAGAGSGQLAVAGAVPAIAGPAGAAAGDQALITDGGAAQAAALAVQESNIAAQIDTAGIEGRVKDSALAKVGELVEKHPEEAVTIIRSWLYNN